MNFDYSMIDVLPLLGIIIPPNRKTGINTIVIRVSTQLVVIMKTNVPISAKRRMG